MAYIMTLLGGFIFSFLLFTFWVPMVNKLGAKGGFLSAFLIIGTCWFINHGSAFPLIQQQSEIFIDMGFAAGVGSLMYGLANGGSLKSTSYLIFAALLGGIIAGIVI